MSAPHANGQRNCDQRPEEGQCKGREWAETISHEVPQGTGRISVRAFLKQKGVSGSRFRSIKNNGSFFLNGEAVQAVGTWLHDGDVIAYAVPPAHQEIVPEDLPLDIRYEDRDLLIVNKPAGMLVHPVGKALHATLANAVLGYYRREGLPLAFHAVHRLDRLTSGLVLIAKHPDLQHLLSTMGGKRFQREYLALAEGVLAPRDGIIDAPIARSPSSIIERIVDASGKSAVTRYRTLQIFRGGSYSLLRLALVTGRTHQIRVHLSHSGHPLLGDDLYGGSRQCIQRQALHAERIRLRQPLTGAEIDVHAELPADMRALLY